MTIRILLVDDHTVVRKGLRTFLSYDPDLEVVGEAADGADALRKTRELMPDVVLMDLLMPGMDGIAATEAIRRELPETEVLALTSVLEDASVVGAVRAGAIGYLLKDTQAEALCQAIKAAAAGQVQLTPKAAARLMQAVSTPESPEALTERETDVLRLLAQGYSNKQIANSLNNTEKTIKTHVSRILSKLGCRAAPRLRSTRSALAWSLLVRLCRQSSQSRPPIDRRTSEVRTAMNHSPASAHLAEAFEPRSEADTSLNGYWLVLVRIVCLTLCVLSVGFYVAGVLSYIAHDYLFCSGPAAACHTYGTVVVPPNQGPGLSRDIVGIYVVVRDSLFSLGYWLVAAFLFWRKSDDRVALLAAISLGTFPIVFNLGFVSTLSSPWWFMASLVSILGFLCFSLFFYVFPSGHFAPSWMRWVLIVFLMYQVLNTFFPAAAFNPFSRSPVLGDLIFFGLIGSFVVVQIYRYRHVSSPIQRQQTKWVVYGIAMGWGVYPVKLILSLFFPVLDQTGPLVAVIAGAVVYSFLLLLPLSIGFAIVRAKLWDIDLIVNRTLVYVILTVCVVGLYVLVVGFLGALIGTSGNLMISLVATGLVAVLFQPLRSLVQREVNRLLYGQRDEPYTVITQLSQRLEATLARDAVLSTIVETVAQALKLPYVAILLKQEGTYRLAASAGELVGGPLVLPLVYQKDTIGHMQLSPRTPGEPFTPADRRLLDELARQAGLAAHTVQLTEDLQRSHEQLEQRVAERTRELSSLLEISHTVASTLHLKPLLGLILDQLRLVIEYTGSSILTIEGQDLVFLDHRGPVPQKQLVRLHFPLEQLGLIWETIASRESILIDDVHEETPLAQALRTAMDDLLATTFQYVCSWMAVPLNLRDQVIGMLVLASSEAQVFTERHVTLALAIANQAAIAIENARLYEQAQELAAMEERQKLARELHDSVSQALYSMALGLHTARIQLDRDQEKLPESLEDLLSLAQAALAEMRALIFELRPESLEREGLVCALSKQGEALQARYDMLIQTNLCEEPTLPLMVKQELYRIAQEALHNTVKHAKASKVDLVLRPTASMVILEVWDDGVGFDPTGNFPGHLGLRSMEERVNHLGGELQIESAPGKGTHLLAQIPIREATWE